MPSHARFIEGYRNNRVQINFARHDLLLKLSQVKNPYTKVVQDLPLFQRTNKKGDAFYMGPNLLDYIERVLLQDPQEIKKYDFGYSIGPVIWRFRNPAQFFLKPKSQKKEEEDSQSKREKLKSSYPFKSNFCTGGRLIDEMDNFLLVEKSSSISISSQLFLLSVAMCNHNPTEASSYIAELAISAWERDLERTELLFQAITACNGELPDYEVPPELKANAAISQEVEHLLFRKVCRWLDIDPDTQVARKRGRPKTIRPDIAAGEYIEIKMNGESISARTIAAIAGFSPDTNLVEFSLLELVTILSRLQELEANDDIDLLIAYLDALDLDWRSNVFEEEEEADTQEDPYIILGVERDASPEDIKLAYRNLARRVHPDLGNIPDWIIKRINRAFEDIEKTWNN